TAKAHTPFRTKRRESRSGCSMGRAPGTAVSALEKGNPPGNRKRSFARSPAAGTGGVSGRCIRSTKYPPFGSSTAQGSGAAKAHDRVRGRARASGTDPKDRLTKARIGERTGLGQQAHSVVCRGDSRTGEEGRMAGGIGSKLEKLGK